ncbi:MAG: transposase, partial [Candidatus Rhabdochlamydia oedothoracis]|nr:transposase [Candidatus Rhabdochlamydia oedothoracis]
RIKALKYLKRCGSPLAVAQAFGVSPRSLLNWKKLEKQGNLAPKLKQRSLSKLNNEKLKHYIQEHADAYLREIAEAFGTTIYACKRLKITLKKRHFSIKKEMKRNEKSLNKS